MTPDPNPPLPAALNPQGLTRSSWGNFQLQAKVGRGAFGEVYRAWDTELQREVALKLLLPQTSGDAGQFDRLLREARALASVRHPNIVPIYGVAQHDGLVGFWTDFVHGKNLAAVVREQGRLGYREAALIGLDVAKALSAVHQAGLLHRDIKAENVMREDGGRILLMDFGLSILPDRNSNLAGTPQYMAPELFSGAPASVATDLYSVGILLFHLVSSQYPGGSLPGTAAPTPYDGDGLTATLINIPTAAPIVASRSLLDFRPDLPETYVSVVNRAIDPSPSRRFQTAGALCTALSDVLSLPKVEAVPASAPPVITTPEEKPKSVIRRYFITAMVLFFVFFGSIKSFLRRVLPAKITRTVSGPRSSSTGANEDYLKAHDLLLRYDKRKNVADAVVILQGVLRQDPNFALAQADLGLAYFLQYRVTRVSGLLDQARTACERATQLAPDIAPPYITLARIDGMTGNTALATQQIQKAFRLDPNSPEAWGAQAEIYNAQGRTDDAIASAQGAMDRDPDSWRWPVLLGAYLKSKQPEKAADLFRKAVELAPDNSTALLDLGLTSMQLNRLDDAKASLEKAVQIEPNFSNVSALAELDAVQGRVADSAKMYRKAADLNPTNYRAWGNLASAYLELPNERQNAMEAYRKAVQLAETARKETPKDTLLLANLGDYYASLGNRDQSVALLRQAVALDPDNPDVLFVAGDAYEILGRRDDAIRLISQALANGFQDDQLNRSPELASLRIDARFQEAVRQQRAAHPLDTAAKND
jgi:serine/threonine protein kinase/Flp pilus assembly protein TadD